MASTELSEKWYYDACTLDHRLATYGEIINKGHKSYTSHLAVGEACSSCLLKAGDTKNYEILDFFVDLLKKLRNIEQLEIVSNDHVESILRKISEIVPVLSITDSLHLATALREQCCVFRTIDNDFNGLTKSVCEELAHENGMSRFAVSSMSPKDREQLFRDKKVVNRKKK
ncbi:MAG: PIN domain-containing protein [Candidatus Paceibacterota bacterium]|jgi:predicted nucleic acid-binding protein